MVEQVILDIETGRYDGELRDIMEAIHDRREILGRRKHREFNVGDVVRFVNLGMGAKYMNGETAVIREVNQKTFWVELTPESKRRLTGTRFGRSSRIKVYPNSLELAFIDGEAKPALKKLADLDFGNITITDYNGVKNVTPEEVES